MAFRAKKHLLKTNESLIPIRHIPTTEQMPTTPTSLARLMRSTKSSQNKEKQQQLTSGGNGSGSPASRITTKTSAKLEAFTASLQNRANKKQTSKKQPKMNLSPILITISNAESDTAVANNREVAAAKECAKERDLTRIMGNFISSTGSGNDSPGASDESSARLSKYHASSEVEKSFQKSKSENQTCVDFGIADYLCDSKSDDDDEIEVDISSDTDSNFIAATPPNQFSDSDFEGIEPISVTLETSLNPKTIIHKIENAQLSNNKTWKPEMSASQMIPRRRPFRRQISLPPTIFMSRFFGNNGDNSPLLSPNQSEMTFILKSAKQGCGGGIGGPFHFPRVGRLESISSADMECADVLACCCIKSNSSWSMSFESNAGSEFEDTLEHESPFTSEIEKKALVVRNMRRLVRQDTTVGNFAPPHYRNT